MQNLIAYETFLELTGIQEEHIDCNLFELIEEKKYLSAQNALHLFLKKIENILLAIDMNGNALEPMFLEKTIQTITLFYETMIQDDRDKLNATMQENLLLKDTLVALQEECQSYQNQVQELEKSLNEKEDEIEFLQRKYKLMWGKVSNLGMLKK